MEENKEIEISEDMKQPLTELEEMQAYLNDPKNRENAVMLANNVLQLCGKNWFTLNNLLAKSSETKETAIQKLQLLKSFGLIGMRIGDFKDGKKGIRKPLFKITISKEDKENAISRVIEYHLNEINKLQDERANLK